MNAGRGDLIPRSSRRMLSRAGDNPSLWNGGIPGGDAAGLVLWLQFTGGDLGIQGEFTRMK